MTTAVIYMAAPFSAARPKKPYLDGVDGVADGFQVLYSELDSGRTEVHDILGNTLQVSSNDVITSDITKPKGRQKQFREREQGWDTLQVPSNDVITSDVTKPKGCQKQFREREQRWDTLQVLSKTS